MWPLLLHDTRRNANRPADSRSQKLDEWEWQITRAVNGQAIWKRIDPVSDDEFRQPYEEVVYFHPFVRKFLYDRPADYPDQDDPEFAEGVRIFERDDIVGVTVGVNLGPAKGVTELTLAVSKVQLFLFDTFVAIAVVRLTNSPSCGEQPPMIELDTVLAFQEVFRRCYPPFWWDDDRSKATADAGLCPRSVKWILRNELPEKDQASATSNVDDQQTFRAFVKQHVQSPVARHFQFLLQPLVPFRSRHQVEHTPESAGESWLAYRQILDERIPVMSYVAVDDPDLLTEADFFRLTFCDSPGDDPRLFPYSVHSRDVRKFPGPYVYDRYWGPKYRDEDRSFGKYTKWDWGEKRLVEAQRDDAARYTTRYLCCGYSFAAVGSSKDDEFHKFIRRHMRHHYFKLGLIAHFGRASLLAFDDRLAYAVQSRSNCEAAFREKLTEIENEFVTFRTRYWFTEVSNHLQAREIFDWWGKHLEVDSLFAQVEGKVHTVNEVLERQDGHELNLRVETVTKYGIGIAAFSMIVALVTLARDITETKMQSPSIVWFVASVLALVLVAASIVIVSELIRCVGGRLFGGQRSPRQSRHHRSA